MSGSVLVLLGGDAPDAPMAWVRVRAIDGGELARGVFANGATGPQTDAYTLLVLRGSEAQIRSIDLSAKTDAQARGAAAFAFEGELAIDPEHMFYAVGPLSGAGNRRLAAALDRRRLQAWGQRCRAAGCPPRAIYLDCTLLPVSAGQIRLREYAGSVIATGGLAGGFAIETALAPMLTPAWLARLPDEVREIEIAGEALDGLAAAIATGDVPIRQGERFDMELALARSAVAPPAYAPNLQQGDLAAPSAKAGQGRAWLTAGVLAIAAVLLQVGILAADGWRDRQAAAKTLASVERDFRQMRPDVKRIVNLRAQVTAALNAAQRPAVNPVIATSDSVVELLQTNSDVRLDEIRHDAPGRRVSLRLSAALPAVLERAVGALKAASPGAEVGQMQTEQGRVSVIVTMVAS